MKTEEEEEEVRDHGDNDDDDIDVDLSITRVIKKASKQLPIGQSMAT